MPRAAALLRWGACCTSCGWDAREDHMALLDKDGYYLVMGGDAPAYASASNDVRTGRQESKAAAAPAASDLSLHLSLSPQVWITPFSFHDLNAVASNCKLSIPSAGVGLRCWPSESGDGCTTSPSSPSLSGAAIAGIIFAILGAAVIFYLLYRYQQQRQQNAASPLLPLTEDAKGTQTQHSEPFLKTDQP
jgi:hypothetical protein